MRKMVLPKIDLRECFSLHPLLTVLGVAFTITLTILIIFVIGTMLPESIVGWYELFWWGFILISLFTGLAFTMIVDG